MPHPSPLDFPATVARRPKRQATDAVEFYGTVADHWSHTQVRDWIMLHPGLTRTAFRLYCLLRSMVSEKRPGPLRRMTLDQVCYLLPGVNGKGTSLTAVKDALRLLGSLGLVTTAEERVVASSGRGGIHSTLRRYQVNDLPPHAYDGWRNAWDKLDSYQPDWRTNPPAPAPRRPRPRLAPSGAPQSRWWVGIPTHVLTWGDAKKPQVASMVGFPTQTVGNPTTPVGFPTGTRP